MKKATKPKARMYKIGDWYTSNKAGVVGQIEKITAIRPDLTRVAIRTPFNEYRLLTVKVTAQLIRGWAALICVALGPLQRGSYNFTVDRFDRGYQKTWLRFKTGLKPERPVDNLLVTMTPGTPPYLTLSEQNAIVKLIKQNKEI